MDQYLPTGQVSFVYKQFAVLSPDSQRAAEASECAAEQNRFWSYADVLFANQRVPGGFSAANLKKYAGQVGMDANAFSACVESGRASAKTNTDKAEGIKYGFKGVPSVVINGRVTEGLAPLETYKKIIEEELRK